LIDATLTIAPLPGTPSGDRFSEQRIGLDHLAIGVSSLQEMDARGLDHKMIY
jgi:hypothetical protein